MPASDARHRLTHVLRHLDATFRVPNDARPGYDALAPVVLPAPTPAAEAFFRGTEPHPAGASEWLTILGERVPVFFDGDLVGSIFYWLSGWQEVHSPLRDRFGRFPYAASLQAQLGCAGLPVADLLLAALRQWLEGASGLPLPSHEPGPPLAVSHDVDRLLTGWRRQVRQHLRAGRPGRAAGAALRRLFAADPFDNLAAVAGIVRSETDLASTFYFLGAQGAHQLGPNADYDLGTPAIWRRVGELERLGCEIGLHGAFGAATDADQLREELAKLPHFIAGVRFHYLCFDPLHTPDVLAGAGAAHDATLGFAERAGFRHGTARPFWLYDFRHQRAYPVICRPLHAMDVTFTNPAYQPTPAAEIPTVIGELARAARLVGGTLSLLWHNEYLVPDEETLGEPTLRAVLRTAMQAVKGPQ